MTDQFYCSKTVGIIILMVLQDLTLSSDQTCSKNCRLKPACTLHWQDRDWVLVFRLSGGARVSAFDSYVQTNKKYDLYGSNVVPEPACKETSGHCSVHYRSGLLDIWEYSGIDKVNVSIYKGKDKKAFILFNGTNTNYTNWFSKEKIIESSWTDLTSNHQVFNYFSIDGHVVNPRHKRTFFIFRSYGADVGWLAVIDQVNDPCDWARGDLYPKIVYSNLTSYAKMSNYTDRADVLTISVKFAAVTRPVDCN